MDSKIFKAALPMAVAVLFTFPAYAQDPSDDNDDDIICEIGQLEVVSTQSNPVVKAAIEKARPVEPGSVPTPKFTIKTHNNKFMLTIGGEINPMLGYDIGNNLYSRPTR